MNRPVDIEAAVKADDWDAKNAELDQRFTESCEAIGAGIDRLQRENAQLLTVAELAYGLLWHMQIDRSDPNLWLASEARRTLLSVLTKDGQARGIDAAKMTDGRFTGAA